MSMVANSKAVKIELLLASRSKIMKRLEKIKENYREEKENEEAWPGHSGTFLQSVEADYDMLVDHLHSIDEDLKKLGYFPNEKHS